MFTKSSLTEHPVRVKIATRAQTEQFALLSEQHWRARFLFSSFFLLLFIGISDHFLNLRIVSAMIV